MHVGIKVVHKSKYEWKMCAYVSVLQHKLLISALDANGESSIAIIALINS
jgi:hypothetical protein